MAEVVGVGGNTADHVCVVDVAPPLGGKRRTRRYFQQPGGAVPTALVALSRWGLTTAYIGPIGDDDGGRAQLASLRREGVDTGGCGVCRGVPSEISFITVDAATGERTILWHRDQRLRLPASSFDTSSLTGARAVLLDDADIDLAAAVAAAARAAGARVIVDLDAPEPRTTQLLRYTDIAIVAENFLDAFAPGCETAAGLAELAATGPSIAVATRGSAGAVAWAGGRYYRQPAFAVRAVDTTSAGDVFHAAFVCATLNDCDMGDTLRLAAAAAALACASWGGRDSIPDMAAVRALAASGPGGG